MSLNLKLGKWLMRQKEYDEAKQVLNHAARCGNAGGAALIQLCLDYFSRWTEKHPEHQEKFEVFAKSLSRSP